MPSSVTKPATRLLARPKSTIAANLAMVKARKMRIGESAKLNWRPVLEVVLVTAAIIVCCFALFDRPLVMLRSEVPAQLIIISEFLSRFGKSDWILIPSLAVLSLLLFLNTAELPKAKLFRLYCWNLWLSFIAAGVGLPSLAATLLKRIVGRPRPRMFEQFGLYDLQPFSVDAAFAAFPSGHSTTIAAFAVVMALLLPKYRAAFAVFAILVGFSRVGVGAHHPSDVVAGLAFGATGAYLIAKWFASHGILFLSTNANWPVLRPAFRFFVKH